MSFISNALGISNGYKATTGAGTGSEAQQATDTANLNALYGQQGDLAQQLLAQSQGQGPNIAQLQLQQATNQNNQQAAGAIASQRGMNPALAQRLISQQQAANNQNAAGQSGVLRAQQQLASEQGLGNIYAQQGAESLSNLGILTGAQTSANNANAQIAQNNTNQNAGIASGIINGVGSVASMFGAEGGEVPKHLQRMQISPGQKVHPLFLFQGGDMLSNYNTNAIDPALSAGVSASANNLFGATSKGSAPTVSGGQSSGGSGSGGFIGGLSKLFGSSSPMSGSSDITSSSGGVDDAGGGLGSLMGSGVMSAHGGKVPAMLSPGELYIPPHKVGAVASGKEKASEAGKRVPGKAKVPGDSLKNDNFPTELESGGIVIKRTKAQNDADAREFLLAIQDEKKKKEGPQGFARVLAAKRKNA